MNESVEVFLVRLIHGTVFSNYKFSKLRDFLEKVSVIPRKKHINSVLANFQAWIQFPRIVAARGVYLAHKYQPTCFPKRLPNTNVGYTRKIHAKTNCIRHESRSIVFVHSQEKHFSSKKHTAP